MQSVAPIGALSRRSRGALGIAFVLIAAGIFSSAVGLGLYVFPLVTEASQSAGLFNFTRALVFYGGILLGILGLGVAVRAVTWRKDNELARITAEYLKEHLDSSYTFIRNINKRPVGYIDAVLVGPPGVLIFRILDWQGTFLGEKSGWLKPGRGNQWVATRSNPTKEVVDDIRSVRSYLAEYGLTDVAVFGIVVFIHDDPNVKLMLKDPIVPATHLASLENRLHEHYLAVEARIDKKSVKDIVDLLYDK